MSIKVKELKKILEDFPKNTDIQMIMLNTGEGCARDIYEISALSIIPGDNTTYILLEGEECAVNDEQKAEFLSLYKEL